VGFFFNGRTGHGPKASGLLGGRVGRASQDGQQPRSECSEAAEVDSNQWQLDFYSRHIIQPPNLRLNDDDYMAG
jgi:hypothetical protein